MKNMTHEVGPYSRKYGPTRCLLNLMSQSTQNLVGVAGVEPATVSLAGGLVPTELHPTEPFT